MQLPYFKMQGTGNQIVVIDQRRENIWPPSPDRLRQLSDESAGLGFDQLMWLTRSQDATMVAGYRVFNADGSEVEQCGNGVRCVAALLAKETGKAGRFKFEGPTGSVEAIVLDTGRVTVNMGAPNFDPACIPFVTEVQADRYGLNVADELFDVAVLSMGNPHCVLVVDDVARAPVDRLGPLIESHSQFPSRTNVGFMRYRGRTDIDLRVYERGVGETLACGTGACAAVVAGHRAGALDTEVAVQLPGGQLVVSWRGGTEPVWLTGGAELTSEGTIDL